MSKKKTATYALKIGHSTPFRRTIDAGGKRVQLVFVPNVDYELTDEEIKGCQDLIDGGLLVDPNRDAKGRQRRVSPATPEAESVIAKLEKKIEKLAARNAELESLLESATSPEA